MVEGSEDGCRTVGKLIALGEGIPFYKAIQLVNAGL